MEGIFANTSSPRGVDLSEMRTIGDARPAVGPAADRSPDLTGRQLSILHYLAEGYDLCEIARRLGYSASTIKKDVHLTIRGCGARSRAQAVAVGIRTGLI